MSALEFLPALTDKYNDCVPIEISELVALAEEITVIKHGGVDHD